jgi:catechol 2,3-dioxygenase-like lactoylglutathione lyase family enzyme
MHAYLVLEVRSALMLTGVGSVAILVNDAKQSAEWYRDELGFEVVGNEGYAVFVRPTGTSYPLLHLCGKCEDWGDDRPGGRTGIWLSSGDVLLRKNETSGRMLPASDPAKVEQTYDELKRKGVEFAVDLTTTTWGKYAILKDPDGNEIEIS